MATKTADESKLMLRMSDLISEPYRILPPIKGYKKKPLVSLEQAIQPLLSLVPDLEEMVWIVKQNCQHLHDHLSADESASIMLFTLEWMPRESSFYFILNNTLRSRNRNELLPWFLYLRLFMFALSKLPPITHRMIYCGIEMDVGDEFSKGKTFTWWSFTFSISSIEVLEEFLSQSGHRTIFNIECDSAKDISKHSFYEKENVVLIYPARQFQVVSSFNSGNGLKIIYLKEIQPRFPRIHIPQPSSTITDQVKEIELPLSLIEISKPSSTKTHQNKRLKDLIELCEYQSKVDLEKQNLNDEDINIVVEEAIINKQCEKLRLNCNKVTSIGASFIAEALNNNITLKELYLTDNHLGDMGLQSLTKVLSLDNSNLSLLSLQKADITDEGAKYIAEMLKTNATLNHLLLGWNKISDRGVELLADALTRHNKTLQSLLLCKNKKVSDLSVDFLIEMLKHNQALKWLDMERCNLSKKGKKKLEQIARSKKNFELIV